MFRAAESGLEDFRIRMNLYNHKENLSVLENCHLYILCTLCNACSLIKNYCLCDQRWEEVFITGNIYVLINESIKKLVGFPPKEESKKINRCGSKRGFYCDFINDNITQNQRKEFDEVRNSLTNFADNKEIQELINGERNMSIHFDDNLDALNLFRTQSCRNTQQAFDYFILWFGLMCKLNYFIIQAINNGKEQDK